MKTIIVLMIVVLAGCNSDSGDSGCGPHCYDVPPYTGPPPCYAQCN